MNIGPLELSIILVIVFLIFGVGRVSRLGQELGTAVRELRRGLSQDEEDEAETQKQVSQANAETPKPDDGPGSTP